MVFMMVFVMVFMMLFFSSKAQMQEIPSLLQLTHGQWRIAATRLAVMVSRVHLAFRTCRPYRMGSPVDSVQWRDITN